MARWLLHDLRNPTQALTLIPELMDDAAGDDRETRETIRESGAHLTRLLELLDRVLRPPLLQAEPGPVSLRDTLEFLEQVGRLHRGSARLEVRAALDARLPSVTAVGEHLEHALLALTLNAFEAAGPRRGTARVTAEVVEGRVLLAMEDDGPGVAPEIVPRLGEPFATTRSRPLAGLGLFAARDLLRRSGSTLEYAPRGAGARFVVGLDAWKRWSPPGGTTSGLP